jgi:hypothetical protein
MSNNIELLSKYDNFTIGTNSNLTEILANVVKVGTDTSNVTISIPQDISSSYNLILPARQGISGESLVYSGDGQLKWHKTEAILRQVVSVYGENLTGNTLSHGTHQNPIYLDAYTADIKPVSSNSNIFVQFKVNYKSSLAVSNQITFYIKKIDVNGNILNTYSESLFGPNNGAGGFIGQYISNIVDKANTTEKITYQLGYNINGTVDISNTLGILGYDTSYNNTIVLQEFSDSSYNDANGSGPNTTPQTNGNLLLSNDLTVAGNIIMTSNTGNVTFSLGNISSSYNLILPESDGSSGQALVYGNNGQLSWETLTNINKTIITMHGNSNSVNYIGGNTLDTDNYYSWIKVELEKTSIGAHEIEFFTETSTDISNRTLLINGNGIEINTINGNITLGSNNGNISLSTNNNLIIDVSSEILFNINDKNLLSINSNNDNNNIDINAIMTLNDNLIGTNATFTGNVIVNNVHIGNIISKLNEVITFLSAPNYNANITHI